MTMQSKPILFWLLFTSALIGIIQLRDCDGKDRGDSTWKCSQEGRPTGWNPSTGKWECGAK